MSLVYVSVGFMSFMAATTLAIDVGMFMTARNQTQNSADAAALAGAVAMVHDSFTDRSVGGPVVQSALRTAAQNAVAGGAVDVQPSDVTFPLGPGGLNNRVRVQVFRSADRSNPVATLLGGFFGVPSVSLWAAATAEASPANAATCVAPFAIPDKWTERQTPGWDPGDSFNAFPSNPSLQPDIYHRADQSGYTGYDAEADRGLRLTLKAGTGNNIASSFYYALALPGSTGADDYEWNIANCNTALMHLFDPLTAEPGNMVGPTRHGVEELIAQDPGAYWDTTNNRVVSTQQPSPRVKIVPVFDPYVYNLGKMNGRPADLTAANYIGFFIEGMQGNDVIGRITPIAGVLDQNAGPAPDGAFAKAVRLVQ
jgi:hypothetical protein